MEKYLEQCLDSVVNQTLKDIEIICINDGSTDNSLQILKDYAARDTRFVILDQENTGQGLARNKCIEVAKGEYLAFIDPDDWVDVHMYEEMYNAAVQHDCDVVECDYIEYHENKQEAVQSGNSQRILTTTGVDVKTLETFNWKDIKDAFFTVPPAIWTKIYKMNFIKQNGIVFSPARRGEDQPFGMGAYFAAEKIHFIDANYYYYRILPVRKRLGKSTKYFDDSFIFHAAMQDIFSKHGVYQLIPEAIDKYFPDIFYCHLKSLLPFSQYYKYLHKSKKVLTEKQFKVLQKRSMHVVFNSLSSLVSHNLEKLFSFKKKKIDDNVIKELSIFNCPVMKFNVGKK